MSLGATAATTITKQVVKLAIEQLQRNDKQLERDRLELALDWGAELKQAVPQVLAFISSRIDDLADRINEQAKDAQVARVFTNFAYEAAREAIDERRKMLAHASAGLLDPDIPVERKARVERTLRELDPDDVLALHGVQQVVGTRDCAEYRDGDRIYDHPDKLRYVVLRRSDAGDVLVASGCVRVESSGGGAGATIKPKATVTRLGDDVLRALRSFIATRGAPFPVPGKETAEGERTEGKARKVLDACTELQEFVQWIRRDEDRGIYEPIPRPPGPPLLRFFIHDWQDALPRIEGLRCSLESTEIELTMAEQPYNPGEGAAPYNVLRLEFRGPHDLLRYIADDSDAYWS